MPRPIDRIATRWRWLFAALAIGAPAAAIAACGSDSGSAAPSETDGGADATADVVDAAIDRARPDVAQPEAAPACAPEPVAASALAWKPPRAQQPTACSAGQAARWYDICWGPAYDKLQCDAFERDAANRACLLCIFYAHDDTTRGAAEESSYLWLNLAGCAALVEGDAGTCGPRVQARADCVRYACEKACPIVTNADYDAFNKCEDDAYVGLCKPYVDAEGACLQGAGLSACRVSAYADFRAAFIGVSAVFCGGGGDVDAGDAGTD